MAIPEVEEIGQVDDDLQKLALAQSYFQMSESAAWKDLMGRIQGLVDQAEQELFADTSPEAGNIILLKTRWQQRKLTHAAINKILESQLEVRQAILYEMETMNERDRNPA